MSIGPVTDGLLALDMAWARKWACKRGHKLSDDEVLAAMHKARYARPEFPLAVRQESAAWLIARGEDGIYGEPIASPQLLRDIDAATKTHPNESTP